MTRPIWEGVYPSFNQTPASGPGFNEDRWVRSALEKIENLRRDAAGNNTVSPVTQYRESLLPVVAAIVHQKSGRVRILDFGGGIGFSFYQVLHGLPDTENLEFHVVEIEPLCRAGKKYFRNEQGIFFHSSLSEAPDSGFDIVHMGSSLHYCEDWVGMLSRLSRYAPGYFLFTDLPAGDIPTFATVQNYYTSRIPVWFFNINEVLNTMKRQGYGLVFRSTYIATVLGQERKIPQDNFEEQYRLGHTCNLLFSERGSHT